MNERHLPEGEFATPDSFVKEHNVVPPQVLVGFIGNKVITGKSLFDVLFRPDYFINMHEAISGVSPETPLQNIST